MDNFYRFSHFSQTDDLIHAISKRDKSRAYEGSMALHTGEDRESIVANRWSISKKIIIKNDISKFVFIVANQTHSANIKIIEESKMAGWENLESAVEDCDALITNQQGVILTILTADCVPILIYDPRHKVVAAIHAGWRGTEQKIASKTISVMQERFDSHPSDLLVGIAPAIGRCCYEVGDDVVKYFKSDSRAIDSNGDKYMLDLPYINREQMITLGVISENIQMSGICTACKVESFFSYRQERGCSGRFMSMIGLDYQPSAISIM